MGGRERAGVSTPGGVLPALLESALETGAEARFEVDGRSMLPLIRPGDTVRMRRLAGAEPRLGDVVAIKGMPGGGLLVHRVVRLRDGKLLLRGDNTLVDNGEFAAEQVLGVVSGVERGGRDIWFGAGRWGRVVALAVRAGTVSRLNRVTQFVAKHTRG
jgi:signal peptidase I